MSPLSPTDVLGDHLRQHIEKRIGELIEEEMKTVTERIHKRVRAEVGSIASTVLDHFQMERGAHELIIRVDLRPRT